MNSFVSSAERLAHTKALITLQQAGVPFLVGGAYAMFHYTGLVRYTKDLDLFLRPRDEAAARAALDRAGYRTDALDPVWLSKAYWGDSFVDLIFCSGNGLAKVDDDWFDHAPEGEALGVPSLMVPVEEMIWSKAFVQERERYDGADVAHLILARGRMLDWARLLDRFGPHWGVLLGHLTLFAYSYPSERDAVPRSVWRDLLRRASQLRPEADRVCRGTLLSRTQYVADVGIRGFRDARVSSNPEPASAAVAVPAVAEV